jgi:Zn-dependent peptidase ImmA (M78 family)
MTSLPNRKRAEEAAKNLWRKYEFASPADLKIDVLAYARGVVVIDDHMDSADARLLRRGNKGLVRVNRAIPEPGRRRFVIAHEVGHFEMHAGDSQYASCTSEDMVADYKGSKLEVEANWFAAELLMPSDQFRKEMDHAFPSFDAIRKLKDHFLTSITATALRFIDFSEDYCALVVSENGRVRWWRANDGFRQRCFIRCGMELPEGTAAGAIHRGEKYEEEPVKVDAEAWGGPAYETDWWEDVQVMPNYGQTLSLIRAG